MHIELKWDEQAIEHIARHHVTPEEVQEVTYDSRSLVFGAAQKRYFVYGRTGSGRYLKVIVERLRGALFYPVTAYEMDEADQRRYDRQSR